MQKSKDRQIFAFMLKRYFNKGLMEAGCDEAGRGCFAGPVFAAAVILPPKFYHPLLNDSKQVTQKNREILRKFIESKAIAFAVSKIDEEEIDTINILWASIKAMHHALDQLTLQPEFILIDGNRFKTYNNIQHECIVKGDGLYTSIAAASILAKTYRDDYMMRLHDELPFYNWKSNKGYGTREHCSAIRTHGLSKYHRKSFNIIKAVMQQNLPETIMEV